MKLIPTHPTTRTVILGAPETGKTKAIKMLLARHLLSGHKLIVWVSLTDNLPYLKTLNCRAMESSAAGVLDLKNSQLKSTALTILAVRLNPLADEVDAKLFNKMWKHITQNIKPEVIVIDDAPYCLPAVTGKIETYQPYFDHHKGAMIITSESMIQVQVNFDLNYFNDWVETTAEGVPKLIGENRDELSEVLKIGIIEKRKSLFEFLLRKVS